MLVTEKLQNTTYLTIASIYYMYRTQKFKRCVSLQRVDNVYDRFTVEESLIMYQRHPAYLDRSAEEILNTNSRNLSMLGCYFLD